ncbi:MAG: undecaprenyldiphospho-muramoylpentapeptide beta-N-acetylglucosaminyltransferase [Breznakia sp.]
MNLKILMVTGGTGGHIYPALALAEYIEKKREVEFLFVGNDDRMEAKLIPQKGFAFQSVHAKGLVGNPFQKLVSVCLMMNAYRKAKKIIREFKPDVAIGFGGYVSVPLMKAAQHLHVKTILHEQNSILGVSNKVLVSKADAIVVCYEKCLQELPKAKTYLYGNPRASIAATHHFDEAYFKSLHIKRDKRPLCLVVMGSLGSSSINEKMAEVLKDMKDIQFLYVSGKQTYKETKQTLTCEHIHVVDYIDQLSIVDAFDFIIARAGATTAAEISASGLCSILIPSPYVAHNHQYYNAKALVEKQAAYMIEEKDLDKESLKRCLRELSGHPNKVQEIKKNAKQLGFPNACEDMLKLIERI